MYFPQPHRFVFLRASIREDSSLNLIGLQLRHLMFKSFFLWSWYEWSLNWQHVQLAQSDSKPDTTVSHVTFKTRWLPYTTTKWLLCIHSIIDQHCMSLSWPPPIPQCGLDGWGAKLIKSNSHPQATVHIFYSLWFICLLIFLLYPHWVTDSNDIEQKTGNVTYVEYQLRMTVSGSFTVSGDRPIESITLVCF